jgi:hypothetical protein
MALIPPALATALDVVGISLAVLDFTGVARKVEAGLARYRDWERQSIHDFKGELASTFNLRHHLTWDRQIRRLLTIIVMVVPAALVIWLWGDPSRLSPYIPNWPEWVWWSLLALVPILYAVEYLLSHVIGMTLGYVFSTVIWGVFWVLSRPKVGVLGTIGLLLAFFDSGLNLVMQLF